MTYEEVAQWCIEHIDSDDYKDFSSWYDACYDKIQTPSLFESPSFNRMLEDYWLDSYGSYDKQIDRGYDTPESRARQLELPSAPTPTSVPVIIPQTGRAPEIPRPVLVFPSGTPQKQKRSILSRIKDFFRRKK